MHEIRNIQRTEANSRLDRIDQSRKDCLGSKGGMSTESTLYNTYMALPDQHAAQDVFDSSRVNARVSTRFSRQLHARETMRQKAKPFVDFSLALVMVCCWS